MLGATAKKMKGQHEDAEIERFKQYARACHARQAAHSAESTSPPAAPTYARGPSPPGAPLPPPPPAQPQAAEAEAEAVTLEPAELPEARNLDATVQIWRQPNVVSMFQDPFISMRDPEFPSACRPDGEYSELLKFHRRLLGTVLHRATDLLPSFTGSDCASVKSVIDCLDRANHTALWMEKIRDHGIPKPWQAGEVIQMVVSRLKAGEVGLLPLGYLHSKNKKELGRDAMLAGMWGAFALIIEPTSEMFCTVVVCASGGDGLQYHPRATDGDKVKAAPIVLRDVVLEKVMHPAFTSILQRLYLVPSMFGSQPQVRILYEVLLPFLIDGKSVAHTAAPIDDVLYSTPQRVSESRVRTCMSATKYLLVRAGIGRPKLKALMLALRYQCLDLVKQELEAAKIPFMTASDIRSVRLMGTQLSLATSKAQQQNQLDPAHLSRVTSLIGHVDELLSKQVCPFQACRESLVVKQMALSKLEWSGGPQFPASFADSDTLRDVAQTPPALTDAGAGVSAVVDRMPLDADQTNELCSVLESTVALCDAIRADGNLDEPLQPDASRGTFVLSCLQITTWLDDLFERVLPVPKPEGSPGCSWAQIKWTEALQTRALRALHAIASHYTAASVSIAVAAESPPPHDPTQAGDASKAQIPHGQKQLKLTSMESARGRASRSITLGAILALSDALARQPTTSRFSVVLGNFKPPLSSENLQGLPFNDATACLELTCLQALRRKELMDYFVSRAAAPDDKDAGLWDFSKLESKTAQTTNDPALLAGIGRPLKSTVTEFLSLVKSLAQQQGLQDILEPTPDTTIQLLRVSSGHGVGHAARRYVEMHGGHGDRAPGAPPPPPLVRAHTHQGARKQPTIAEWLADPDTEDGRSPLGTTFEMALRVMADPGSTTGCEQWDETPDIAPAAHHLCTKLEEAQQMCDAGGHEGPIQWCCCRDIALMAKAAWRGWEMCWYRYTSFGTDARPGLDVMACVPAPGTRSILSWTSSVNVSRAKDTVEVLVSVGGALSGCTEKATLGGTGPGASDPRAYVTVRAAQCSEEHLLFCPVLPTFDDYISQEETELLLSGLTAPVMRIPLSLSFFGSERASLLFHPQLRALLRASLLEPFRISTSGHAVPSGAELVPFPPSLVTTPWGLLAYEIRHCTQQSLGALNEVLQGMLAVAKQSDIHSTAAMDGTVDLLSIGSQVEAYAAKVLDECKDDNPALQAALDDLGATLRVEGWSLLQTWLEQATQQAATTPMIKVCICIAEVLATASADEFKKRVGDFLAAVTFVTLQMEGTELPTSTMTAIGVSRMLKALRYKAAHVQVICGELSDGEQAVMLSSIVRFATSGNECTEDTMWCHTSDHLWIDSSKRVTLDLRTAAIRVLGASMQQVPSLIRSHLDVKDCISGHSSMLCSSVPLKPGAQSCVQITQAEAQYQVSVYDGTQVLVPATLDDSKGPLHFDGTDWMVETSSNLPLVNSLTERYPDYKIAIWRGVSSPKVEEVDGYCVRLLLRMDRVSASVVEPLWRLGHLTTGTHPKLELFSLFAGPPWVGSVRWPVYTTDSRRSRFEVRSEVNANQASITVVDNGLADLQFEAGSPFDISLPHTMPGLCRDCLEKQRPDVLCTHGRADGQWLWCESCAKRHDDAVPCPSSDALVSIVRLPIREAHSGTEANASVWAPGWQLAGLLPAFLIENFLFWRSCSNVGVVYGVPRDKENRWTSYQLRLNISATGQAATVHRTNLHSSKELLLLDVTGAAPGSETEALGRRFAQLEDLCRVTFWVEPDNPGEVVLVELPRLSTSFLRTPGSDRLYSADNGNFCVSSVEDSLLWNLVGDLPSYLLLEEAETCQLQLMVANPKPMVQTPPGDQHLLSHVKLDRGSEWLRRTTQRFFLYPVHPLRQHFDIKDFASSMYLFILRLITRDYQAAADLVAACATDKKMDATERWIFNMVVETVSDTHPEAAACRLMLVEATIIYNNVEEVPVGWDVVTDAVAYCSSLRHVRPGLRLNASALGSVLQWSLAQAKGAGGHQTKRMASFQQGDAPTPHSWSHSVLSLHKRILEQDVEQQEPLGTSPECFHGGGGWNRLEVQVEEFFASDKWKDKEYMPMALLRPPSAMAVPRGQAASAVAPSYDMVAFVCSADCWTHADNSLLFAYELLRGSLEPERGNSRGYVQMMALAIYLEQQNVQGTPFWPETTQHLFAAMAFNDAVGAALPAVKRPRYASAKLVQVSGDRPLDSWIQEWFDQVVASCQGAEWRERTAQVALVRQPVLASPVFEALLHPGGDTRCLTRLLANSEATQTRSWFIPDTELAQLATRPLESADWLVSTAVVSSEPGTTPGGTVDSLPYDVSRHPESQTSRARALLQRVREDVEVYNTRVEQAKATGVTLKCIDIAAVEKFVDSTGTIVPDFTEGIAALDGLRKHLTDQQLRDRRWIDKAVVDIVSYANDAGTNDSLSLVQRAYQAHALAARDIMLAASSSTGEDAIRSVNSHCDSPTVIHAMISVMLVCSRLTQAGRALQLLSAVRKSMIRMQTDRETAPADIAGDMKTHVANLTQLLQVKRFHTVDGPRVDPRFLAFECAGNIVLRERQVQLINEFMGSALRGNSCVRQMLMGAGKSSTVSPLLGLLLADGTQLVTVAVPQPLLEQAVSMLRQVLASIFQRRLTRFFFSRAILGTAPDLMLSNAQQLHKTLSVACEAGSIVVTTGSAIKALLLKVVELMETSVAAGDQQGRLAIAMPLQRVLGLWAGGVALLDECDLLLHPFKSEMNFPIHEKKPLALMVQRTEVAERLVDGLFDGVDDDSTDSALRAAVHSRLAEGKAKRVLQSSPHVVLADKEFYQPQLLPALADWLLPSLQEKLQHKDALLAPLASDQMSAWASSTREPSFLQFDPITGQDFKKDELHLRPKIEHSAECAIDGGLSTDWRIPSTFWCSAEAKDRDTPVCEFGITLAEERAIGAIDISFKPRSPFLGKSGQSMLPSETTVLLSAHDTNAQSFVEVTTVTEFQQRRIYLNGRPARHIKLVLVGPARWFAIEQVAVFEQLPDHRSEITKEELCRYISESPLQQATAAVVKAAVPHASLQLLNIARDSLTSFFPHCIGKIDRVAFGLLPAWLDSESESVTRRYMAIPFTGKDTPSAASEFSHPDILIVLTLLAYRYEGLRRSDMQKVVGILKTSLKREMGPLAKRPSYRRFGQWLAAAPPTPTGITAAAVLPLELFDPTDERQCEVLWALLCKQRSVISFFIREFVFPVCLHHKCKKISATGEELGGDALFRVRLGFSGTPSTLLPRALGQCDFEAGTEGQIARVLSDPHVVSAMQFEDWSVEELLTKIATTDPPIHALIDIGALITGLESQEVAAFMLERGLPTMAGVVYVSQSGEKVILTRGAVEPVPLEQSSVQPGNRFTFYDQHHTTGVDIAQAPTARAVVTVGKDSILRDYAQGAWRMRRLGQGQTLQVWLIPEVARLVQSSARRSQLDSSSTPLINLTMAWLVVNSLRGEKLQAAKLQDLQTATVVRAPAIKKLLSVAPVLSESGAATAAWDAETERDTKAMDAACAKELAEFDQQLEQQKLRELENMKAEMGYGLYANQSDAGRLTPEERDARGKLTGEKMGAIHMSFQRKLREHEATLQQQLAAQKAELRARRAENAPKSTDEAVQWLHRCMAVLIEPMEFGVASTVGGGPSAQQKPAGYDEACRSILDDQPRVAQPKPQLQPEPEPEPEPDMYRESPPEGVAIVLGSSTSNLRRSLLLAEALNDRLATLKSTLESDTSSPPALAPVTVPVPSQSSVPTQHNSLPRRTASPTPRDSSGIFSASLELAGNLAIGLERLHGQLEGSALHTPAGGSTPAAAALSPTHVRGGHTSSQQRGPSAEDGSASGTQAVSDIASVFYDNEVQNEKEQEQQVEIMDDEQEPASVYPGGPNVEESFAAKLLRAGGRVANKQEADEEDDEEEAATAAGGGAAAAGGGGGQPLRKSMGSDGRTQIRSLVQGAELALMPSGVMPWYSLAVFDMDGLGCAIEAPAVSRPLPELRFSTNHTAEKQQRDRDGAPITRRLRNIVTLLHHLPAASAPAGGADAAEVAGEDEEEWLLAVSLAEGQSLVLLLREAESVLGGEALGLLRVEDGAVLAATPSYQERRQAMQGVSDTDTACAVGSGRQLMRFINSARRFSAAEVEALAVYLVGIEPKERQRYYTTVLRGRRRDTSEHGDGEDDALRTLFE